MRSAVWERARNQQAKKAGPYQTRQPTEPELFQTCQYFDHEFNGECGFVPRYGCNVAYCHCIKETRAVGNCSNDA